VIAFTIAISVIRALIERIKRFWGASSTERPVFRSAAGPASAGSATTLRQDPVCGTYVPADSSLKKIVGGTVHHFCSQECRDKFR
jgi:YHS domain-containing protein